MELQITELSKTYPNGVEALKNINLNIPTGMYGLLGPNGAGKSTLMRTIASLQDPDDGSIRMNGLDFLKEKHEVRKRLGYLPQEFGVYPSISAEGMLDHFAALKGVHNKKERKELVEALLQQTNLMHAKNKKLTSFSGGMKQRFGIAQALIGNPQIIIVDEPTAGLDPAERNRFHNLLSEIGENKIVILSTHIVEDVSDLCKNMAILHKGEVKLEGVPMELMENIEGRIWEKTIEKEELSTCKEKYNVVSSRLFAGKVVIHIFREDEPEDGFIKINPDLEDVYFSTINGLYHNA